VGAIGAEIGSKRITKPAEFALFIVWINAPEHLTAKAVAGHKHLSGQVNHRHKPGIIIFEGMLEKRNLIPAGRDAGVTQPRCPRGLIFGDRS